MFTEYRELISKIKGNHPRFDNLYERHSQLDKEIKRLENTLSCGFSMDIAKLKLDKLNVKRDIQKILEQESRKSY